jgi:hypothetical protein
LAWYRDGAIFAGKFAGESARERHPNGNEIVQIADGATMLHVMTADEPETFALGACMVAIAPWTWHRLEAAGWGERDHRNTSTDRASHRRCRWSANARITTVPCRSRED